MHGTFATTCDHTSTLLAADRTSTHRCCPSFNSKESKDVHLHSIDVVVNKPACISKNIVATLVDNTAPAVTLVSVRL